MKRKNNGVNKSSNANKSFSKTSSINKKTGDIAVNGDIIVQGVKKSFGPNLVLNGFDAIFRGGELTFLTGPSGCGKTTLLNILMGLLPPDEGTITGVPLLKSAVFQEDRLCESFNAVSNVRLVCNNRVTDDMIISHLEETGLKGSLQKPVSELSGGMRRRVAIVRAILAESDVLFLDEPFKGLDDETKKNVIRYMKAYTKDKTVIMVTHDSSEIEALNGNVILMPGH